MNYLVSYLLIAIVHATRVFSVPITQNGNERHEVYRVQPYHIDLSENVPHMLDLIRNTELPDAPEYAGVADSAGISLSDMKALKEQWLTRFDWEEEEASMNKSVELLFRFPLRL